MISPSTLRIREPSAKPQMLDMTVGQIDVSHVWMESKGMAYTGYAVQTISV